MTKSVLVTGGSRGIGAAIVDELGRAGWEVLLGYRVDIQAAEEVIQRGSTYGNRVEAVQLDVTNEQDITAAFDHLDSVFAPLGALVNSAGIVDQKARVDEMSTERLQQMFAVNAIAPFLCAKAAIRRMSTRYGGNGGVIVNVSSAASRLGSPGEYVDYAASKGAVDTMTIGLAREVAKEGIRVNAVRPGIVNTAIHASGGQPDRIERLAPLVPMGRAGEPEEVAQLVRWLCSGEAPYLTGALIDISGGR